MARTPRRVLVPRRMRRIVVSCALGVVALACVGVLVGLVLSRATPRWWRSVPRDEPATITLAEQVENGLVNRAYRNRDEPWTVEITAEQANAWLAVRLPKWAANQGQSWPGEVSEVQVAFAPGRIVLGARVRASGRWHVVSADVSPRIEERGLYLDARGVSVGRLGASASWAARVASPLIPERAVAPGLMRAALGEEPIAREAAVKLEDGRRLRVMHIEPGEGWLRVTFQTEPIAASGP
ncbi:MAG: hypothetical protein ACKVW3_14675 [Phycisphaerales bacterium]